MVAIQERFAAIRTSDAQEILRLMDLLDENLPGPARNGGYLEVVVGRVHFLVEFAANGGARFAGATTNAALIFGGV